MNLPQESPEHGRASFLHAFLLHDQVRLGVVFVAVVPAILVGVEDTAAVAAVGTRGDVAAIALGEDMMHLLIAKCDFLEEADGSFRKSHK